MNMEKYNEDWIRALEVMQMKETMLAEIIVWLKAKGYWEDCKKDLSIVIVGEKMYSNEIKENIK
jgi:hypothetical protein